MKKFQALILVATAALIFLSYSEYKADRTATFTAINEVRSVPQPVVLNGAEKQVITLPEDGGKAFTTVYLPGNWKTRSDCGRILNDFAMQPELVKLKVSTHWNVITANDPMYGPRYATAVGPLPCVAVTDSKGTVYYKANGDIPSGERLVTDIATQLAEGRRRNRPCPWVKPDPPAVTPVVPEEPNQEVIPEIKPPESHDFPTWIAALLLGAGGLVGGGPGLVKKFKALG